MLDLVLASVLTFTTSLFVVALAPFVFRERIGLSRGLSTVLGFVGVLIASEIKQGVVSMVTGSWYAPAPDGVDISGNPNVLTEDCGTSRLGQGAAAHNVGVEVKKFHESLSPLSH